MVGIRRLENNEIDKVMDIWKQSTIEAHSFIPKEYWENKQRGESND